MELDVVIRGQSNAFLLLSDDFGGVGAATLIADLQKLLGFDGVNDKIRLTADWYTPGQQTVYGGTSLIGDWVQRGTDGSWQAKSHEQDLLNYIAKNPHPQATETAVVWLHSEYDSLNTSLTKAEWESAVRTDASWVRKGLGLDAAHSPYVFVSAIPFVGASNATTQAIRLGMEELSADRSFGALVGARDLDLDMSYKFPTETTTLNYGSAHMSKQDTVQTGHRLALALAEEWAQYARPNSPVALAKGNIADEGPKAVSAILQDAATLLVKVAHDQSAGFAALDPQAAGGIGWSVRNAAGAVTADSVKVVSADTLQVHFTAALPTDGVAYYGYGYGRLAAANQPGEGNAVYDQSGLPLWTPAKGVALSAPTPAQIALGTGSDTLVLRISQDAYQGSAQYTVKVDNVQIGGVQTATALHLSGMFDTVTIKGDWGVGSHSVAVTFLNDALGSGPGADRNLFVDGITYDGVAVAKGAAALTSAGTASFALQDSTAIPGSSTAPAPAEIALGTGSDTLVLRISQDAYQGSAQYTVKVDNVQIGGVQTATAWHSSGLSDTVTIKGTWATGDHKVAVTFLNDAWGGSAARDRNLHVDGMSYDGVAVANCSAALVSNGAATFTVHDTDQMFA
jgi:hypothetical protein